MCLSAIWSPKPQLKRHLVIFSFYLPFEIQYGVTIARSKVTNAQFNDITMDSVELVICIVRIYHMNQLVLSVGLEPTPPKRLDPKSSVAANYTTRAYKIA